MNWEFSGEAIWWRGPAPFVFVAAPDDVANEIRAISAQISYGWGVIPATITIGQTTYTTSLFPKNGGYLVPIKSAVQRAESLKVGDQIEVRVAVESPQPW